MRTVFFLMAAPLLVGLLPGCALFRDPYESQHFSIRKSCYEMVDDKVGFTKAVESAFTKGMKCVRDLKTPTSERLADEVLAALEDKRIYIDCEKDEEEGSAVAWASSWHLSENYVDSTIHINAHKLKINEVSETVLHELLHIPGYVHYSTDIDYMFACSTHCFPESAFLKEYKKEGLQEARDICSGKYTQVDDPKYIRSLSRLLQSLNYNQELLRNTTAYLKRNPKNRYAKFLLALGIQEESWPVSFELLEMLYQKYSSQKLDSLETRYVNYLRKINVGERKTLKPTEEAQAKTLAKAYFHYLEQEPELARKILDELQIAPETEFLNTLLKDQLK